MSHGESPTPKDARRKSSAPMDRTTGLICDQSVALMGNPTSQNYPDRVRRIRFRDLSTAKTLIFLTNNFKLPAAVACALYKRRWQVEFFFKWIRQHLRIRRFFGTSENAERRKSGSPCRSTC
jgi:IS4 transposase